MNKVVLIVVLIIVLLGGVMWFGGGKENRTPDQAVTQQTPTESATEEIELSGSEVETVELDTADPADSMVEHDATGSMNTNDETTVESETPVTETEPEPMSTKTMQETENEPIPVVTTEEETVAEPIIVEEPVEIDFAPNFTLAALGGGNITLSDYRGDKPVILDFFATWCPNCRRSMPKLNTWYEKYQDQVEVIGVNRQESASKVASFIENEGFSFPVVLDPDSEAHRKYGNPYTNVHVLINKDGSLKQTIPGDITEAQIVALIDG